MAVEYDSNGIPILSNKAYLSDTPSYTQALAQNLKNLTTTPVVTQLPSKPTVGDRVIYTADATYGVYWQLLYDGIEPYPWKFLGGAPLLGYVASVGQQTTTSTWQNLSGPSATLPLAGDYDVAVEAGYNDASTAVCLLGICAGASILRFARAHNTAYGGGEAFLTHRATAVAAATVIRPQYWVGVAQAGGYGWGESTVSATPVRVAAPLTKGPRFDFMEFDNADPKSPATAVLNY